MNLHIFFCNFFPAFNFPSIFPIPDVLTISDFPVPVLLFSISSLSFTLIFPFNVVYLNLCVGVGV